MITELEITMYETLQRPHDVNQIAPLPSVSEIGEKLKKSELKREEKRLKQIANARSKGAVTEAHQLHHQDAKRKRGGGDVGDGDDNVVGADGGAGIGSKRFKTKSENEKGTELSAQCEGPSEEVLPWQSELQPGTSSGPPPTLKVNVSKSMSEVRGHTSYLTFACLLPEIPAEVVTAIADASQVATDEDIEL
jgi:tRNA (adenine57-N1/adenine58-N1)-methyltransferase